MSQQNTINSRYQIDDLVFDPQNHYLLKSNGDKITLSIQGSAILRKLILAKIGGVDSMVSIDDLMNAAWGNDNNIALNSLNKCISFLREELPSGAIRTIPKKGFCLVLDVIQISVPVPTQVRLAWRSLAVEVRDAYEKKRQEEFPYAKINPYVTLRYVPETGKISGKNRNLDIVSALKGRLTPGRPALILGEYGQGKTCASGVLAYEFAKDFLNNEDDGCLPLLLPLRYATGFENFEAFAIEKIWDLYLCSLSEDNYRAAAKRGCLVFILDGLDELIARHKEKDFSYYLRQIRESTVFNNNRVIVTTRPNVIEHVEYYKDLNDYCDRYTIALLDIREVESYFHELKLEALFDSLAKKAGGVMVELTARPLYLDMIRKSKDEIEALDTLEGKTISDLYRMYLKQWYLRERSAFGTLPGEMTVEDVAHTLAQIAYEMGKTSSQFISQDRFEDILRREWKDGSGVPLIPFLAQARERLILVPELVNEEVRFTFRHDSLKHYFTAYYLFEELLHGRLELDTLADADQVTVTFLFPMIESSTEAHRRMDDLCLEPGAYQRMDILGAILLLWGLKNRKKDQKSDLKHLRAFCAQEDNEARRLLVGNLNNLNFTGIGEIQGIDLRGAKMNGSHFEDTNLKDVILDDAELNAAHMQGCTLTNVSLDRCSLRLADLQKIRLENVNGEGTDFREANMPSAVFEQGSSLIKSHFDGANLVGAKISQTVFSRCTFESAELRNVEITRSKLLACTMSGAAIIGWQLDDATETTGTSFKDAIKL